MIGDEAKAQILAREGRLPDAVIACVGGGSNAIGLFTAFKSEQNVRLIGVEPAGLGIDSGAWCTIKTWSAWYLLWYEISSNANR